MNLKGAFEWLVSLFGNVLRRLIKSFLAGFTAIGTLYSAYELYEKLDVERLLLRSMPDYVQNYQFSVNSALFIFLPVFLYSFIIDTIAPYFHTVHFQSSEKTLRVRFMLNILSTRKGAVLVGINDRLYCEESKVARKSLHWQLIRRARQSKFRTPQGQTWIEAAFDSARNAITPDKDGSYPNGYVFVAPDDRGRQYVFLVMSTMSTDRAPNTSEQMVYDAVFKLFHESTNIPSIDRNLLYAPILGTGRARLARKREEVALQMAMAFAHTRNGRSIPVHHMVIVFRSKMIFKVDIEKLNTKIDECARLCFNCLIRHR